MLTVDEMKFIDSFLKPVDRRWIKLHSDLATCSSERIEVTNQHIGIEPIAEPSNPFDAYHDMLRPCGACAFSVAESRRRRVY